MRRLNACVAGVAPLIAFAATAPASATCNSYENGDGWTFWHVEQAGKLVVIDELRGEIRAAMPLAAE